MIELQSDKLVFTFPDVHPSARLTVRFQRTLRIPDDGRTYPLPPGLGDFPLRHVDDFAARVPPSWLEHGGVMLPMYQSEALWLNFDCEYDEERGVEYPFAIKIGTGKVSAVTGRKWSNALLKRTQDHLVAPEQPWLDGYCVEKGTIRQFVAMPLGAGYTAEEQITGKAEHGGLQILAYPMKREAFERRFPKQPKRARAYGKAMLLSSSACLQEDVSMGLAPGGRMKQQIEKDPYPRGEWDQDQRSRCFVHICNSAAWHQVTGSTPPTHPMSAKQYTDYGLPWFELYGEPSNGLKGSAVLDGLKSIAKVAKGKRQSIQDNESLAPERVIALRQGLSKAQVREGAF
jgi:hypothetical protein